MIERRGGYLRVRTRPAPEAAHTLHERGYAILAGVFPEAERAELSREIEAVFQRDPPDRRSAARSPEDDEAFRYAMLNRSALSQRAIGHPRILETIEPLLGEDCHVIANTAWRNPPGRADARAGGPWHIDGGPHVPRPEGTAWPADVPYPVFAVGAHLLLRGSRLADGPTGVVPGSHRSGRFPPRDALFDDDLAFDGERCVPLVAAAGDVLLFVSDVWHRRLPTRDGDAGRFFLQAHYARRDIAQRIETTASVNHLSPAARARARTARERTLLGLHEPLFYDG